MAPDAAADIIDSTRRAVEALEEGDTASTEQGVFLKVKTPGEKFYREVPFGMQTFVELREEIALKFSVKPAQILQILKEPDILIGDDDDVIRLVPNTVLQVNIKRIK